MQHQAARKMIRFTLSSRNKCLFLRDLLREEIGFYFDYFFPNRPPWIGVQFSPSVRVVDKFMKLSCAFFFFFFMPVFLLRVQNRCENSCEGNLSARSMWAEPVGRMWLSTLGDGGSHGIRAQRRARFENKRVLRVCFLSQCGTD